MRSRPVAHVAGLAFVSGSVLVDDCHRAADDVGVVRNPAQTVRQWRQQRREVSTRGKLVVGALRVAPDFLTDLEARRVLGDEVVNRFHIPSIGFSWSCSFWWLTQPGVMPICSKPGPVAWTNPGYHGGPLPLPCRERLLPRAGRCGCPVIAFVSSSVSLRPETRWSMPCSSAWSRRLPVSVVVPSPRASVIPGKDDSRSSPNSPSTVSRYARSATPRACHRGRLPHRSRGVNHLGDSVPYRHNTSIAASPRFEFTRVKPALAGS